MRESRAAAPMTLPETGIHHCRLSGRLLEHVFVDLGSTPLANSYLSAEDVGRMEPFYPLKAYVCSESLLVQLPSVVTADAIFSDYAYFSSYSSSWLDHARRYVERIVERFDIGPRSRVVEIASNDGYLLQYFAERGVPVLGIEPAANVAAAAEEKGIPTLVKFFGVETAEELAAEGRSADLIVGNNVLAHVPDLHDFIEGMRILLNPGGLITMEFPHLLRLMEANQFDTIYHEHFSYFSLIAVERAFSRHDLVVVDIEELPTHGGSLRIFARHGASGGLASSRVDELRRREEAFGLLDLATYRSFGRRVEATKRRLLSFLIDAKNAGRSIVGYGAPAKGNTLLNYCGIGTDFLDYTVDRSPHKQDKFLPGTHVPIFPPEKIDETKPDLVLILPWNLKDEIVDQMSRIRSWGGKFVVPIPEPEIIE